jgi:flagellin
MSKSLERLSSGFRINRAADDAAGLAISEGLRSQIGGLTQAVRNTQDGTSVVQTAEGALSESTSILQRMRDLSVQASNSGSMNANATSSIQKEMGQLKQELDRISNTTTFNGTKLLDGSFNSAFQVGANAGQTISVAVGSPGKGMDASGLGVAGVDVTAVAANAATSVTTNAVVGTAGSLAITPSGAAADFTSGTTMIDPTRLNGTISYQGKSFDLSSVQYSSSNTTNAQNITQLNAAAASALGLAAGATPFAATATGVKFTAPDVPAAGSTIQTLSADTPQFTQASGASAAITAIDAAITLVSSARADLGAKQNRFEHTINNLNTTIENTTASESRIRDTDMASEMTNFTRTQILTQAGTSMLAQANQSTQSILKLLG